MALHQLYTRATNWRDAVRDIRRSVVSDREKKQAMASWWQEYRRPLFEVKTLYEAYNELLGRERNRRLIG